jgi:hypothetical protein
VGIRVIRVIRVMWRILLKIILASEDDESIHFYQIYRKLLFCLEALSPTVLYEMFHEICERAVSWTPSLMFV